MKKMKFVINIIMVLILLFINYGLKSENVYIPDAKFKALLLDRWDINKNHDNDIQIEEA